MSRVIVITGASSGIGRAAALSLARRGHTLLLVARRAAELQRVAQQCRSAGGTAATHALDVRDAAAIRSLVNTAVERHGRLDAVIHAAGVVAYGRFEEIPVEIFDGVLATNVDGAVHLARAALPVFRRQRFGHLIVVGSVLGELNAPFMTPYVMSKWALRSLARQLSLENRDQPAVHISCLSPGGVDTPIYRVAANYLGRGGRPPPPVSRPEDVAEALVQLLDRPRDRAAVGPTNGLMRLGFTLLPGLFDRLVGPLFQLIALDRRPIARTPGNVLASDEGVTSVKP